MKSFNLRRIAPVTSSGPTTEVNTGSMGIFRGTKFTTPPVAGSALNLCSNGLNWCRPIRIRFGLPTSFATAKCSRDGPEAAPNRGSDESRLTANGHEWTRIKDNNRRSTQMYADKSCTRSWAGFSVRKSSASIGACRARVKPRRIHLELIASPFIRVHSRLFVVTAFEMKVVRCLLLFLILVAAGAARGQSPQPSVPVADARHPYEYILL